MVRTIGRFGTTLLIASSLGIVSSLSNPLPSVAGVVTLPDGGRCEGEISSGTLNGKVVCQYSNGDSEALLRSADRYEGNFVNGKKQGQGVYTFSGEGRYEGEFSDDNPNGKGVRAYPDGDSEALLRSADRYEGEFRNGDKQGQGVYIFADGTRVEGNWKDGQIQK